MTSRYFDKFELYCLDSVLKVPRYAVLAGDLPPDDERATEEDEHAVDLEIESCRQRLLKARRKTSELAEELRVLKAASGGTAAELKCVPCNAGCLGAAA